MVEEQHDTPLEYVRKELSAARKTIEQVQNFMRDPIWLMLKEKLESELEEGRQQYETAQGRSIDELVKNEASRGAIATVRSVLAFPETIRSVAENTAEALKEQMEAFNAQNDNDANE